VLGRPGCAAWTFLAAARLVRAVVYTLVISLWPHAVPLRWGAANNSSTSRSQYVLWAPALSTVAFAESVARFPAVPTSYRHAIWGPTCGPSSSHDPGLRSWVSPTTSLYQTTSSPAAVRQFQLPDDHLLAGVSMKLVANDHRDGRRWLEF